MNRLLTWIDRHSFIYIFVWFVLVTIGLQVGSVLLYFAAGILTGGTAVAFLGNLGPIAAFFLTFYFNVFVTLPLMLVALGIKLWRNQHSNRS